MRAGGFISPEIVNRHIYVPLWDNEQRIINNEQNTIAIPAFLSVAQRNVSLRPPGRLIIHYALRCGRRVGDIGGWAINGYIP